MPKPKKSVAKPREESESGPRKTAPIKLESTLAATPIRADVAEARADSVSGPPEVESAEERSKRIALRAYYRAEQRGFAPGGELEDWLAAENEID
jgi:hypothetical protein